MDAQPTIWRDELAESDAPAQARREARRGAALTGRNIIDDPLPEFAVHLSHLSVPDERFWSSFATRSSEKVTMRPLLAPGPADSFIIGRFGLPPVSARPEVGVFGKLTHYESDAVRGELVIDSHASRISDGEEVSVDSSDGLDAGDYRFTPLISAGVPTEEAAIAGESEVTVDDDPLTTLGWPRWVAGAIAAALIASGNHRVLLLGRPRPP